MGGSGVRATGNTGTHAPSFSRTLSTHAQPAHASTLPTQRPTPTPNTTPNEEEAASGSRALLQVINIPLVGTVDFGNVAPFYGQIFSGLIPSDALPFGTDSIAEAGITQGLQSGLNSFAGHTLFEG